MLPFCDNIHKSEMHASSLIQHEYTIFLVFTSMSLYMPSISIVKLYWPVLIFMHSFPVTSFVQNEMTAFQMEPQSKAVKYGSSARFSCNSSITSTGYPSYPNLIITWYKDGSAINIDERIVRQQQGGYSTLEIRSVTNSDAGCYQCSIQDGPSYEDMPCPSLLAGPASYMYITLSAPAYLVVISSKLCNKIQR